MAAGDGERGRGGAELAGGEPGGDAGKRLAQLAAVSQHGLAGFRTGAGPHSARKQEKWSGRVGRVGVSSDEVRCMLT